MPLEECPDCKTKISTVAVRCPCCGREFPRRRQIIFTGSGFILAMVSAIVVAWLVTVAITALYIRWETGL